MKNTFFAIPLAAISAACLARELPPEGTDDAKRPYEMVWAGRTADENAPAAAPLTDVSGWTVETENAKASLERSKDHMLFGDGVLRLVYRADGEGKPVVRMKPPAPVRVKGPVDTFSCWIYGNNFYGKPKDTPMTQLKAHFLDAAGEPFTCDLAHIHHMEWSVFQRKMPTNVLSRIEKGCSLACISVEGGSNREDRYLEFNSFCMFKESFSPISFKPRARRGVQVFPDQPQGVNTGKGKLPFPTVATTVVPVVPEDKDIEFRMPGADGVWDDLAFRYRKGPWIPLAKGGGVWPASEAGKAKAVFRRIGNSVVADVTVKGGKVEEMRFGGVEPAEDAEIVPLPYYTYSKPNVEDRPCVISTSSGGTPLFITATMDWTQTSASEPFPARQFTDSRVAANGGTIYTPKTDGRRNDVYERFVWTVSTDFASTLPVIPNPKSPWKAVTGTRAWRAHGASAKRETDYETWRWIRRKGIRHVVVNDHETGWRDGHESYTFRTDAAPRKGGDKGQYDYARYMIDTLGYYYGPYNNFTDLAPVNANWKADNVLRQSNGTYRESWARCYSPKPLFAVEMCERLTPIIQGKFRFNTAYCDVHTAVTPWSRTDYDWRVPGAGTLAQTFYAYGEIMLIQKANWNGPVYSEGGSHWEYSGLTDGNYAQDAYYKLPKNPWLVDFDLLRMHPLCCNFGIGMPSMFYGDKHVPDGLWDYTDPFVACTVAFGHPPFLLHRNVAYGYFMLQALAAAYTQADAASIRYADADGRLVPTSEAVVSGVFRRSQVAVRYTDGTVTFVNGSRDGEWMAVRHGGGRISLPPYGFFGMAKDVCSFNGSRNGARVAFARCPEYVYVCSREKRWIDTPGGGTDGELTRLAEPGGTEEVIPVDASEIVLPYAARRVVGLHAADMKELGDVEFSVGSDGRTRFKPVKDRYSYRVTLPDGWKEPSAAEYMAKGALEPADSPLPQPDPAARRPQQLPYLWRSGMVMRGSDKEIALDGDTGAKMSWSSIGNEGVWRRALVFHPPYKKGPGCVFARYRVKVPAEGATFTAKGAKLQGSTPGDGILFRVAVRDGAGAPLQTVCETTVADFAWHDISGDLSRWAGRKVDLYLVADPGPADNTYGDGGGWADMGIMSSAAPSAN